MKTSLFSYHLPNKAIAQTPAKPRDSSNLMVLGRNNTQIKHYKFNQLPSLLNKNDLLIFNDSRVIPARLFGEKEKTGGKVELLLLRAQEGEKNTWECMTKPGLKPSTTITFYPHPNKEQHLEKTLSAQVIKKNLSGTAWIKFNNLENNLAHYGHTPLPPYIHKKLSDPSDYQTIYAEKKGSAAAPTAGFHFTERTFQDLKKKGIKTAFVTLHIGLGTFQPVKTAQIENHVMHPEFAILKKETIEKITKTKEKGGQVICVGTTVIRVLEGIYVQKGKLTPYDDWLNLFIYPDFQFKVADHLLTNFHLPHSTLLMLVSAFAGREKILSSYQTALQKGYHFYSFGDAMLIK